MSDKKQAVILVHGMGQQVPMETLRGFVQTMWVEDPGIRARLSSDPAGKGNPVWWKPDNSTGSLELSRITTRHIHADDETIVGPRTDFYELYWADVTDGNTLTQLKDWFLKLMWRWPSEVPPHIKPVWRFLWLLTSAIAIPWLWKAGVGTLCSKGAPAEWLVAELGKDGARDACVAIAMPTSLTVALWILTVIAPVLLAFAVNYFGDVARYTRAEPSNIVARRATRERGLALLRTLTDHKDYDRIVLVGHSLGSILAYDILKFLWSEREDTRRMVDGSSLHDAWLAVERSAEAVRQPPSEADLQAYREAQAGLFRALSQRQGTGRWIVSDFVTLGSPLAHAEFLLERESKAFEAGRAERRFPSNPPQKDPPYDLVYKDANWAAGWTRWRAHHATPFAPIRWTNIYDPRQFILFGDLASGPVSRLFGWGIEDVPVRISHPERRRLFTHTLYWDDTRPPEEPDLPPPEHLTKLREALRLVPRLSSTPPPRSHAYPAAPRRRRRAWPSRSSPAD